MRRPASPANAVPTRNRWQLATRPTVVKTDNGHRSPGPPGVLVTPHRRCAVHGRSGRPRPGSKRHVFDGEWTSARYDRGSEYLDVAGQLADAVTAAAMSQALAVAADLEVKTDALIGNPAPGCWRSPNKRRWPRSATVDAVRAEFSVFVAGLGPSGVHDPRPGGRRITGAPAAEPMPPPQRRHSG